MNHLADYLEFWRSRLERIPEYHLPWSLEYCPAPIAAECDAWLLSRLQLDDYWPEPPQALLPWVAVRLVMAASVADMIEPVAQTQGWPPPFELLQRILILEWHNSLAEAWAEIVRGRQGRWELDLTE